MDCNFAEVFVIILNKLNKGKEKREGTGIKVFSRFSPSSFFVLITCFFDSPQLFKKLETG